ncbi:MAG TPA: MBL fold metallo-hydrolase [Roseiflexaceae bacterium]|nr:MBL fold metallo-hydrolase [Roseiflexaceae bacterium]
MDEAVSEVAAGIYQIRLPLPFALRSVNTYLLRDGTGWTLVDAGLNHAPSRALWEAALGQLGVAPASVQRIVLTHAHPDHYGAAGWLQERSGAPVLLSPGEQAFARRMWRGEGAGERAIVALFSRHGLPGALAAQVADDIARLRAQTQPAPEWDTIDAGDTLLAGGRRFEAIATPGHSEGHLAFFCADERLMLCGDTVLTKITPNIGRWPEGPPDPLADFLTTLERLERLPVDLALPGHGPLIRNFAERLGELRAHHKARLDQMEQIARPGATAFAVCSSVFQVDQLSTHQLRFALAETLAHLEHLVGVGRLERVEDDPVRYKG